VQQLIKSNDTSLWAAGFHTGFLAWEGRGDFCATMLLNT